jgi:hypothetical protein
MLRQFSAGCLILLILSPFTAPFSTCDLATIFGHAEKSTPAAPVDASTGTMSRDATTSVVPSVTSARVRLVALEGRRFSSVPADSRTAPNRGEQSSHPVVAYAALSTILRL